jgi:hypothetical protein
LHSGCGCQARFLASRSHPGLASYQDLFDFGHSCIHYRRCSRRTSCSERPFKFANARRHALRRRPQFANEPANIARLHWI